MKPHFFEAIGHWKNNAIVNPVYVERWKFIAGFKRAGEILADEVIQNHRDQDILIFPILYNYRHYMELAIKEILVSFCRLRDEEYTDKQFHGHSLERLWQMARPQVVDHFSSNDPSELAALDEMIEAIHKLDPKGTAFRYDGEELGESRIGIDTVKMKMEGVAKLLYGIDATLENEFAIKREWERDCAF